MVERHRWSVENQLERNCKNIVAVEGFRQQEDAYNELKDLNNNLSVKKIIPLNNGTFLDLYSGIQTLPMVSSDWRAA